MCNTGNSELLAHIRENDRIALSMNPLAFLVKQHEIVRCVGALFAHTDVIVPEVAGATKRAEALTQTVLARGFAGE